MGQVKAYIRILEKGSGPLDFDAHGGMDTSWQRIYLALRAGFHSAAVEVSRTPPPCPHLDLTKAPPTRLHAHRQAPPTSTNECTERHYLNHVQFLFTIHTHDLMTKLATST